MRRRLIILLLLVLPFCVRAQKKDSLIIEVIRKATGKTEPLYVMNDKVVTKKKVAKIRAADVVDLQVIGKPGSVELYGKDGEHGVVIITLKKDFAAPPNRFIITSRSVFYLDEKKITNDEAGYLNPDDMAETKLSRYPIGVLKDDRSTKDVMHLISKSFAVASYQKNFGERSKAYRNFVKDAKANSGDIIYIVDGIEVLKDKDQASKLYHISQGDIQNVVFVPKKKNVVAQLLISTKK